MDLQLGKALANQPGAARIAEHHPLSAAVGELLDLVQKQRNLFGGGHHIDGDADIFVVGDPIVDHPVHIRVAQLIALGAAAPALGANKDRIGACLQRRYSHFCAAAGAH